MSWQPAADRYESGMVYNRCGRSGLRLPAISLGLWHNFGDDHAVRDRAGDGAPRLRPRHHPLRPRQQLRARRPARPRRASAASCRADLAAHRDELIVSTKAGYLMWPGPYGEWGSRKYLLASLDQSLRRMGLDYVDIFYSHRFDPDTPLEETMGALAHAVRSGKALYAGISSYSAERTAEAAAILRELGTPCLIHQPTYSMINRWVENGLLDTLEREGIGCIAFSPLAQGMLTDKYLGGIPEGSRVARGGALRPEFLSEDNLARIRALDAIAKRRGQTLAQMALAWVLKDPRVTSALIGASSTRPDRGLRGRPQGPALLARGAGRDRPPRHGRRRRPVEPVAAGVSAGGTMAGTSRRGLLGAAATLAVAPRWALARPAEAVAPSPRVEALLAAMTLAEKLGQLTMVTARAAHRAGAGPRLPRAPMRAARAGSLLNLVGREPIRRAQRLALEETRLGMPLIFGLDVVHGHRTVFPIPLAEAGAFDPSLWERTARRRGGGGGGRRASTLTFAPMLDVARDPRWGRIAEGPGEDPWSGRASPRPRCAASRAPTSARPRASPRPPSTSARYGAVTAGRDYAAVDVSERTLRARSTCRPSAPRSRPAWRPSCRPSSALAGEPMTGDAALLRDLVRGGLGLRRA